MPSKEINGHLCHYELTGFLHNPVIVFSHSLGTDSSIWNAQRDALQDDFCILTYDTRGHGQSETTEGYTIETLGKDVVELLKSLQIDEAHFVGISMGGLIGQWLAIHKPKMFTKVSIANTSAKIGFTEMWQDRAEFILENGMANVTSDTLSRSFTENFLKNSPAKTKEIEEILLKTNPLGYAESCRVIGATDLRPQLKNITTPMMIIAADQDISTTVEDAIGVQSEISNAQLAILSASHLSNIEDATGFNLVIRTFFTEQ